ncbi:MAG: hypothetical protein IT269_03900 [Saprospiraceae bacterium]|nr:hypothetical protein [Saprospiraceae bacterium]
MEQLYLFIANNKVSTDEAASQLMYPGEAASSKFINLKERVKERLLNALFMFDNKMSRSNERQKAYYDCQKKLSAAMILQSRNARSLTVSILEDLLRQTRNYEFTDLSMFILSSLRLHYGSVEGNKAKYEMYRQLYAETEALYILENKAEDLYTQLLTGCISSKSDKYLITEKAKAHYAELEAELAKHTSFKLHLSARMIQILSYDGPERNQQIAAACHDAIDFFRSKKFVSRTALQVFQYQLVLCYIQNRDYVAGRLALQDYETAFEPDSIGWFKLQELTFLLNMHTGRYEEAVQLTKSCRERFQTVKMPTFITEIWQIYYAYAQYMCMISHNVKSSAKETNLKLLLHTPKFSQDKRGMNIPILIIQFLYNLSDQNYNQSIDRIEALAKYCSRYLRNDETFRSNCFLRMLIQIPGVHFQRDLVIQKTAKLRQQLNTVPLEMINQSHEIEIIPYEVLWDAVVENLPKQQFKTQHKRGRKVA